MIMAGQARDRASTLRKRRMPRTAADAPSSRPAMPTTRYAGPSPPAAGSEDIDSATAKKITPYRLPSRVTTSRTVAPARPPAGRDDAGRGAGAAPRIAGAAAEPGSGAGTPPRR